MNKERSENRDKEKNDRMNGRILWFDTSRRYGFLTGEDGNSYFIYIDELENPDIVQEGDRCIFTPSMNKKGLNALNVVILNV